ncbi:MAG: DeoR/GlpR family DNA-binding transcription regulator, partial [Spirochaetota bacterium]
MDKEERRIKILELLSKNGSVEVSELARLFHLSEMSIRNDLNYLARNGKLQRTYGGALIGSTSKLELSLREKQQKNMREKSIIGKAAAEFIHDGDTIMLDSGTTTQQLAKNLVNRKNITVITNGINIVNTLAGIEGITLYTVGGQINARSFAIVGSEAEKSLKGYLAGVCVISVDGVDLKRGLTNNSQQDVNVTRILIQQSEKKILLCDSSKLGQIALIPICPLNTIAILVTDESA